MRRGMHATSMLGTLMRTQTVSNLPPAELTMLLLWHTQYNSYLLALSHAQGARRGPSLGVQPCEVYLAGACMVCRLC